MAETRPRDSWRSGYDGLFAAVVQRAVWDWHLSKDVEDANEVAGGPHNDGNVSKAASRLAQEQGYDRPRDELLAFFYSPIMREMLGLCGVEPEWFIDKVLNSELEYYYCRF